MHNKIATGMDLFGLMTGSKANIGKQLFFSIKFLGLLGEATLKIF